MPLFTKLQSMLFSFCKSQADGQGPWASCLDIFQDLDLCKPYTVRLTDDNYYTIPPVSELELDGNGDCWVVDFTIGHHRYGEAIFPGDTNVAQLDLDAVGMNMLQTQA